MTDALFGRWKETYKWSKVMTCVSGLLSGSYFIDHYGDIQVHCSKTNLVAKVHFKKVKLLTLIPCALLAISFLS